MKITFTSHARIKFKILEKHGFKLTENQISEIVKNPESTSTGRKGRKIFQNSFDDTHAIRVICEVEASDIKVITFYPARKDRYEN
jgi:hypothetical protein